MNQQNYLNKKGELWVNVASGSYPLKHFINIDFNRYLLLSYFPGFILKTVLGKSRYKLVGKFKELRINYKYLYFNCSKPIPFANNSIDHILCSHFIEHASYIDAEKIIRGFHNKLKPGGTLHAIVPDLEIRAKTYLQHITDKNAADNFLDSLTIIKRNKKSFAIRWLEFIGSYGSYHKWMYDKNSFTQLIEKCGFSILEQNNSPSAHFRSDENAGQVNVIAVKNKD